MPAKPGNTLLTLIIISYSAVQGLYFLRNKLYYSVNATSGERCLALIVVRFFVLILDCNGLLYDKMHVFSSVCNCFW